LRCATRFRGGSRNGNHRHPNEDLPHLSPKAGQTPRNAVAHALRILREWS
jgi:hypothetical protein